MTSLSPPTDAELRRISERARYNVSVGYKQETEGFVAIVCDALLDERAAHSATRWLVFRSLPPQKDTT